MKCDPAQLNPQKTLFIIDGSSFLYRAYYGMRPLHTKSGEPVQAVYSFCRMVRKLIDQFHFKYCALVWDSPGKTERHELYKEYKAKRSDPPSDIFQQKERIISFADLIGLSQIIKSGIEADDLMYSLAHDWTKENHDSCVVLVTSDKDMGQALSKGVIIFDPFKDSFIDRKSLEFKMGFSLEKLPFYFALVGDTSDNIPGVRGIGPKGATTLVQQFDSLEHLYNNLDQVASERTRTLLTEHKNDAFMSRDLFVLKYYKTQKNPEDLEFHEEQWPKALPFFQELQFKSLVDALVKREVQAEGVAMPSGDGEAQKVAQESLNAKIERIKSYGFKTITTEKELQDLCKTIKDVGFCAIDTEGDDFRPMWINLAGISICAKKGESFYIPCGHHKGKQLSKDQVIVTLKPILEDDAIKKFLQNAKFDQLVLSNQGIELRGVAFDTMIAANLLTPEWQRVNLKALSEFYFGESMLSFKEVCSIDNSANFSYVSLDLATLYSAYDAHQAWRLTQKLTTDLAQDPQMESYYFEIEHPLIDILYRMEREGIFLDAHELKKLHKPVNDELVKIDEEIASLAGLKPGTTNYNSSKQMQQLLFEKLQLPKQKKSAGKTGYSTDQGVLIDLARLHPVPGLIVKYRELSKLKNTYIDALPDYINPKTNRIHTTFGQVEVATGRLASSDPNLQNIPAGGASGFGMEVRAAFKPTEGNVFISADYAQLELRVLAHLSQDANLIKAFKEGHDIHAETAARLFDISLDQVTHDQRQIGKRINFSILYGLTPYGLSKSLGISMGDARRYILKYLDQYPEISVWMENTIEETKKNGYVTTFWGRRRYIPGIYETNRTLFNEARRVAINARAQGTAAEIVKKGMIAVDRAFAKNKIDARLLLQIHDEIVVSCRESDADKAEKIMQKTLESIVSWSVPFSVTVRRGYSWKEVTK